MELVLKENDIQYRLIIRDELTNKSMSMGIYNTSYDLKNLLLKIKLLIEEAQKQNGI